MAAIKRTVYVCDMCGRDEPTQRYVVTFPEDGRRSFDLCAEHAAPLAAMHETLKGKPRKGPRMKGQPVVPESVIRRARKKPAKKAAKRPASRPGR